MYIPKSFAETDVSVLYQFMRDHNFAIFVTHGDGGIVASHLPFTVDADRGVLKAHLARANPQWKTFDGTEALVIFQGAHAYVSPTWYESHPSVPTWNYATVHVYGVPQIVNDAASIRSMLTELVENHEHGRDPEWEMQLPDDYYAKMVQSIVVFEMPISNIEGKFKLSQNRSEADQTSVIAHLAESTYLLDVETAQLAASRRVKQQP
ncbi:MAG: FMN-binding negative transcriptional regulator [Anaerolineae bacterium]|nr:FMN-binding negative transcriptional regulator [Anaerolineae bacterium]